MKNVYLFLLSILGIVSTSIAQINSTGAGGDWSNTATWVGGVVPTAADDVVIVDGSVVTIDVDADALSLTIGQGTSGTLQFEDITARTLTVATDATVAAGGIFRSAVTGTVTSHVLSIGGNLTNDGTLTFSTNGNTAGAEIIFTGVANNSFSGTGATTDILAITIDKGTDATSILELNTSAFLFKGSANTAGNITSFLTILNGTFKISGTFTMNNGVFSGTGAYNVPASGGLWLNNPNFTVEPRTGNAVIDGTLTMDAGVLNIGTNQGNRLAYVSGTVININGGTINLASRMTSAAGFGITYTQTGGTFNLNTVANASGGFASFDIRTADNSSFTMSGGTIVLQNAGNSGSGPRDYNNKPVNVNITGGTLQIGNASSGAAQTFLLQGVAPALVIDNTSASHTAQLLNDLTVYGNTILNTGTTLTLDDGATGYLFTQLGSSLTNSGTINGTIAGSKISFSGTSAQTYDGDGILTSPLASLELNNAAGLTIANTIASDITTLELNMLTGDITTGVSTLTLGTSAVNLGLDNYVSGTIVGKYKKWFNTTTGNTNFQVGISGSTRTASVDYTTAPTTGGTLTAEWISLPASYNGLPLTEPGFPQITDIASDGYWSITAADGLTDGVYTGTFRATNVITVTNFTELVLVKRADNVSPWTLDGTHVVTSGSNTTPILSRTGMTGFSEFGIGGSTTSLPITIEYFKGSKQTSGNLLDWKISCTNTPTAIMVLERSSDARKFSPVNSITATAVRCLQPFNYIDATPNGGVNYYRIKVTDVNGKATFSNVIALLNKEKGFSLVSLMPNPVKNITVLSVASAVTSKMDIIVTDISGKQYSKRRFSLVAGSNLVSLDLTNLANGTYLITGYTTADANGKTLQFVKD